MHSKEFKRGAEHVKRLNAPKIRFLEEETPGRSVHFSFLLAVRNKMDNEKIYNVLLQFPLFISRMQLKLTQLAYVNPTLVFVCGV